MTLALDHLILAARTLDEGRDFVKERLGVEAPIGGEHPLMGTHNRLMALGAGVYFEIMAIAPHLPAPARPRWVALDDPVQQDRLAARPRLAAWVARTEAIDADIPRCPEPLGEVLDGRRGDLSWKIAIAADGRPPLAAALPILIQWPAGPHVSTRMADLGCRLRTLTVRHPEPARVLAALKALDGETLVRVEPGPPGLIATIAGPKGTVTLD